MLFFSPGLALKSLARLCDVPTVQSSASNARTTRLNHPPSSSGKPDGRRSTPFKDTLLKQSEWRRVLKPERRVEVSINLQYTYGSYSHTLPVQASAVCQIWNP